MCMSVHCYEWNAGLALNLIRPNKQTSQWHYLSVESSYVML